MGADRSVAPDLARALELVLAGESLDETSAEAAMRDIMSGRASEAAIAGYLVALRMKGETPAEIIGSARAMRQAARRVNATQEFVVDTCGTGGDGAGTFNISTGAALVAAAAGAFVAKHGNRSVSSRCGSADVLEALGIPVELEPAQAESMLARHRFAFLFAPHYHGAMRHAMPARRALATRTVFNLLGPLTNPAGVRRQVVGVFSETLLDDVAAALHGLGVDKAFVVHAEDGIDEISLCAPTQIVEVGPAGFLRQRVTPEDFGLERVGPEHLAGGDVGANAAILAGVLEGRRSPARDAVILNAGAALTAAGKARDFPEGMAVAAAAIDDGRARDLVAALREENR